MTVKLEVTVETWPVDGTFTISRGARRETTVVLVTATDGVHAGRGEAVPYPRYGETVQSTAALIRSLGAIESRAELASRLPAGAARNAIDCALWDLEAHRAGTSAAALAGILPPAEPPITCYTLSLGRPEEMAGKARASADKPLLKLKLGGAGDDARMRAVRNARPDARLVADANEAWRPEQLEPLLAVAHEVGMELIEQPLPAGEDHVLAGRPRTVPVCADESAHTSADLGRLGALSDAVNIKLDKAGGLTEALAMARSAKAVGFRVMVGCMLSTSLAMAPALLLAPFADWLDLDGPLLLSRDRSPAMAYRNGRILPPPPGLWG
jgi:L-Ala-D/L-Glu epimerase